ncbi:hypothetical protein C0993_006290, partial [Termitomyces sp. T159_Od127]
HGSAGRNRGALRRMPPSTVLLLSTWCQKRPHCTDKAQNPIGKAWLRTETRRHISSPSYGLSLRQVLWLYG